MKHNCWTCAHDFTFGAAQTRHCAIIPTAPHALSKAVIAWADGQVLDRALMPPPNADGCPGYMPAAPMMGAPEEYTAMHIAAPVIAAAEESLAAVRDMPRQPVARMAPLAGQTIGDLAHVMRGPIAPPVDLQDRAQDAALPQTEAQVYSPPERDWDADDDGREIG